MTPLLEAALAYAARGWAVLPLHSIADDKCTCGKPDCKSPGKHPRTGRGVKDAVCDAERIRTWWDRWPASNVGIATGEASGIVVLDVDDVPRLEALVAEGLAWERTPTAETGSGGMHIVFSRPAEAIGNSSGRVAPRIDVRGEGGYIVAPPSLHRSGRRYAWITGPDVPPAPMPEWLLQRLRPPKRRIGNVIRLPVDLPSDQRMRRARAWLAKRAPAVEGSGGDTWTFTTAAELRGFGLSEDETYSLLLNEWNPSCLPPWEPEDLRRKVENAFRYSTGIPGEKLAERQLEPRRPTSILAARRAEAPAPGTEEPPPAEVATDETDDSRPTVFIERGRLGELATAGERIIIERGFPVFARGGALVRPVVEEVDATRGRRTKTARLKQIDATYMRDLLGRAARWAKFDGRSASWVRADPPLDIAQTILARDGEWSFQKIRGVITTPTLRPDGSLLAAEGYDPATELYLMAPPRMPPIPQEPTRDDAISALAVLEDLLCEFPFADDTSRSVALSELLTPIARGVCTVVPAHANRASTPGTGKSYLVDVAAAICIGQPAPVMAVGRSEEETEKRLGAALLAGQPLIAIDNVNGELGGDALCQLIERPVVEVRILGKSERVRIESRSTLLVTGNNLQLVGDMTRRVLLCTLEAHLERPELRQFRADPVAKVLADRGRYVAAALTVVRSYLAAGQPDKAPRLASFEAWSDTVRSALLWLDRADPVGSMELARAEDPVLAALRTALGSWREAIGTGRATARTTAEIFDLIEEREPPDGPYAPSSTFRHPELREAVLAVGSVRGRLDARMFSRWLSRHRGRIVAGLRLCSESNEHRSRWWLEEV